MTRLIAGCSFFDFLIFNFDFTAVKLTPRQVLELYECEQSALTTPHRQPTNLHIRRDIVILEYLLKDIFLIVFLHLHIDLVDHLFGI